MTTAFGLAPTAIGVLPSVKLPSLATLKIEIVSSKELIAYRIFFDGRNARPAGVKSCCCGVCAPVMICPVAPSMCSRKGKIRPGRRTWRPECGGHYFDLPVRHAPPLESSFANQLLNIQDERQGRVHYRAR